MKTTDQILEQRGEVYGDFYEGVSLEALILNSMTDRYEEHHGLSMDPVHVIYLSKIVMKLSRLAVSPNHLDSWTDIAGYARLVEIQLTKEQNAKSQ
ncbi:MAG: DUF6378 domain-containing protein [Alphaproteobacteria bacterium]